MRKLHFAVAAATCSVLCAFAALKDGLEPIPTEMAQQFGKILSDEAAKIEKLQLKVEADATKATGLHVPKEVGLLAVPQKDLKPDEDFDQKLQAEKGTPLGNLFLYHLAPLIDGVPADATKLRTVKIADDQGNQHSVNYLILAARMVAEDDYRLYVYGTGDKPIIEAKFSEGVGPGQEPIAVEVKEVDEAAKTGKFILTVFGKYQASFKLGHKED